MKDIYKVKGEVMKFLLVSMSNRESKDSNTLSAVQYMKYELELINIKYNVEVINLNDCNILQCIGCMDCFTRGQCPLSERDDVKFLVEKIEGADHIVFASPVYFHNVPSVCKNFLDRISHFTHVFKFIGKTSSSITTTATNGSAIVSQYLSKVLQQLGSAYLGGTCLTLYRIDNEAIDKVIKDKIKKHCIKIVKMINEKSFLNETFFPLQNETYKQYKKIYNIPLNGIAYHYEASIWKSSDILSKNSFYEAFECAHKRGISK